MTRSHRTPTLHRADDRAILEGEYEPVPPVPWATRLKTMRALREALGEAGFVQCFLAVMTERAEEGGAACRLTLRWPRSSR